jgi:hypothetical protein
MRKKIVIFISVCLLFVVFIYFNVTSLRFSLDTATVYSIEYCFEGYPGMIDGETTDKEEISEVIRYLNSLSLPRSIVHTKGAVQHLIFKDKDGNKIKGYSFGCGIIVTSSDFHDYMFGDSQTNKLKTLLHITETSEQTSK